MEGEGGIWIVDDEVEEVEYLDDNVDGSFSCDSHGFAASLAANGLSSEQVEKGS